MTSLRTEKVFRHASAEAEQHKLGWRTLTPWVGPSVRYLHLSHGNLTEEIRGTL